MGPRCEAQLTVCCDYEAMVPLMDIIPNLYWMAAEEQGYATNALGKV